MELTKCCSRWSSLVSVLPRGAEGKGSEARSSLAPTFMRCHEAIQLDLTLRTPSEETRARPPHQNILTKQTKIILHTPAQEHNLLFIYTQCLILANDLVV